MDILFLSHCVPNPPDKGEKIRAHHEINRLSKHFRVHLVCFARSRAEVADARALAGRCASVYVELLRFPTALARAGLRFVSGACLNQRFYYSRRMQRHVVDLVRRERIARAVAYTVVMAPYVPEGIPFVLDMLDLDSEKWFQYSETRRPGFLFALEANRLRKLEIAQARRAGATLFTTRSEELLFHSFAPDASTRFMENGVDFDFFDPDAVPASPELASKRYVVFTGSMDYYPNIEAVCWFAAHAFPELRRSDPELEFYIVGRSPSKAVMDLARSPGVRVTGAVPDVRPYLKHELAQVAPLRIARGIQNKVLEALAMGKPVLASAAVAKTFGRDLPAGVIACDTPADYAAGCVAEGIREHARERFSWSRNTDVLVDALNHL